MVLFNTEFIKRTSDSLRSCTMTTETATGSKICTESFDDTADEPESRPISRSI